MLGIVGACLVAATAAAAILLMRKRKSEDRAHQHFLSEEDLHTEMEMGGEHQEQGVYEAAGKLGEPAD